MNHQVKSVIFAIIALGIIFSGLTFNFNAFSFDKDRLNLFSTYFIDSTTLFFIFIPTLIYYFLFRPQDQSLESKLVHLSGTSSVCMAFGWSGLAIGIVLMSVDMRPETVGPNTAISFISIVYSTVANIFITLYKNHLQTRLYLEHKNCSD